MQVNTESVYGSFREHLSLSDNNRILFSGKFGTGKSHFLRSYFEQFQDEYNVFWISPTNYVVGANSDIFEWIKVDIARNLLDNYIPKQKSTNSHSGEFGRYLYQNPEKIVADILKFVGSLISKNVTEIDGLESFSHLFKIYSKFRKRQIKDDSEYGEIAGYVTKHTGVSGSIFEDDIVTQVIRVALLWLKQSSKKSNILLIDDLDRIDPDHIFRILNILSSHNDHFGSNKFGFDISIVVCDILNIEHLFYYRYGPISDFAGYIDKYSTYKPYSFSIKESIIAHCQTNEIFAGISESSHRFMILVVSKLFEIGRLRVRNLKKIYRQDFNYNEKIRSYKIDYNSFAHLNKITALKNVDVSFTKVDIVYIVHALSIAVGSYNELIAAIEDLKKNPEPIGSDYFDDITETLFEGHVISKLKKDGDNMDVFFNRGTGIAGRPYSSSIDVHNPLTYYSQYNFMGVSGHLPLEWDLVNKYEGGHFFQFREPIRQHLQRRQSQTRKIAWQWSSIGTIMLDVIKLIQRLEVFESL